MVNIVDKFELFQYCWSYLGDKGVSSDSLRSPYRLAGLNLLHYFRVTLLWGITAHRYRPGVTELQRRLGVQMVSGWGSKYPFRALQPILNSTCFLNG
jgi:hypothetical protein